MLRWITILLLLFSFSSTVFAKISAQQVAIVVNTQDKDSRLIADYYRQKRGIPEKNIIKVSFPAGKNAIGKKLFNKVLQQVRQQTPESVQYYALAWSNRLK